jgi:2'-5' RNA ligase
MRLFLGIDLPDKLKLEIDQYLRPLKTTEKGWEKCRDFHLTLLFIGDSSDEKVEEIKRKLSLISFKPFELTIDKIEFFPRRVMFLSCRYSEELQKLKEQTDKIFPEYLRPDEKAFLPHITIKRWQRYEFDKLEEGSENLGEMKFKFLVNKLNLFKSERNTAGEKYHVIDQTT